MSYNFCIFYVLCLICNVLCLMSSVFCLMSYVLCLVSYVLYLMYYVLIFFVFCPMFYVYCLMSYVLCLMSFFPFYSKHCNFWEYCSFITFTKGLYLLLICLTSDFQWMELIRINKQACCAGCRRRPFPMQLHK